ncbi:MAG: hypothetical protein AAFR22_14915, partial [Chloroflexota bacterium]
EEYATAIQFEAQPGQSVDIVTTTPDEELDTFLILLNPEGREITRIDDPRVGETDAALYRVNLPDEGLYTVIVTRYRSQFGFTEGVFALSIDDEDPDRDFPPPLLSIPTSYGVEQSQELSGNDGYIRTHTFSGEVGEVVTITANRLTEDIDPTVILTDSAGNEIYVNDDINTLADWDAAINRYVLPYTGHYTIVVYDFNETGGGYELLVEREERLIAEEHRTLTIVPMDHDQSETLYERDSGILSTGFFVGDHLNRNMDEDLRAQTVLTYYIPPETPDIAQATLDLSGCDEAGLGFETVIGYNVYMDNEIEFLWSQTPFRPSEDAVLIGSYTECTTIDVTEAVASAFDDDTIRVQFRIIAQSVMADGETDAIVFTDPRLTLIHEPR